ncbi:MAG TPA: type III-B CRISPR module-associated protein Cmr5 [Ktedonobacteraceae bacterium]|nr:type III-B CRISPR module-associated protein Cmr5 [Ktedonobacteraceae bacterium]
MLTRDQKYASIVYDQVCKIRSEKQEKQEYKKYGAMAHKLPILIYTAGLTQALEFLNARDEEVLKRLLKDLAITVGQKDADALLCHIRGLQLSGYMILTQQILAALLWYKRFAQSVLGVSSGDSDDPQLGSEVNNDSPN